MDDFLDANFYIKKLTFGNFFFKKSKVLETN